MQENFQEHHHQGFYGGLLQFFLVLKYLIVALPKRPVTPITNKLFIVTYIIYSRQTILIHYTGIVSEGET